MSTILHILNHTLSITFFVFVMMLLVEYLNVISRGRWEAYFCRQHGWRQYIWAALLGAMPGCLGAFTAVTLYNHRMFSLGAVVAAMIATSGDESFVMFAMFPDTAFLVTAILFLVAIPSAYAVDLIFRSKTSKHSARHCDKMVVHDANVMPIFPDRQAIKSFWSDRIRIVLTVSLVLFVVLLITGTIGPQAWNWKRITFIIIGIIGIWIIGSSSRHFIREHLWRHVTKEHLPKLFAWTFLALLIIHFTNEYLDLESLINESQIQVILFASLVGIIPSSGPHLLFVSLFSKGLIPLATLVASSIVQDGHGMLPLLAFSRRDFLKVKGINLFVGVLVGVLWLVMANLL